MELQEQYAALTAPFDSTYNDPRGFTYITGEQCVTRMNTVLGPENWGFEILEHGINEQADEIWVKGRLTVFFLDANIPVVREQFGSQKVNRKRNDKTILDIGFDLKGAATDAMKKCAMNIGVGLYLSSKEEPPKPVAPPPQRKVPAKPSERTKDDTAKIVESWATLKARGQKVGIEIPVVDLEKDTAWIQAQYRMGLDAIKEKEAEQGNG